VLQRLLEPKQYTSAAFAHLANDHDITLSLGRTGQCWDNALAESFFASLKGELIDPQAWPTKAAARLVLIGRGVAGPLPEEGGPGHARCSSVYDGGERWCRSVVRAPGRGAVDDGSPGS
jgi:transposase InsO family protein